MKRRRSTTTLSLSFLDAICCGFGALVLLFLILSHNTLAERLKATEELWEKDLPPIVEEKIARRIASRVILNRFFCVMNSR